VLPPGEYYIMIEAYWLDTVKEVREVTVNNYSKEIVEFSEVKATLAEFDSIQSKALYFYSMENPKKMINKRSNDGIRYMTGKNQKIGVIWYSFVNTNKGKRFTTT
jgi:hypothetical protein